MLHDALRLTGRKQRWKNMWKLSVYNASVAWKGGKKKCSLFQNVSNQTLEQSVRSVKLAFLMWFDSVWKWEVRDCRWLSQTTVCDAACAIFLFFFLNFFFSFSCRVCHVVTPRCTDSLWPRARRFSSISTVWPNSFQQLARVSNKS